MLTPDVALPYLLKKPTTGRFISIWFAMTQKYQDEVISDIRQKVPEIILVKSPLWNSTIDGTMNNEARYPKILNFVLSNYSFYKDIEGYWLFKKNNTPFVDSLDFSNKKYEKKSGIKIVYKALENYLYIFGDINNRYIKDYKNIFVIDENNKIIGYSILNNEKPNELKKGIDVDTSGLSLGKHTARVCMTNDKGDIEIIGDTYEFYVKQVEEE